MSKGFKGFPGGAPGGGNMQALMKQAQKMQEDLQKVQEESLNLTAEGSSGGGVVKVVANGKHEILSVVISPDAVSKEEVDILQDLIIAASNDALRKIAVMLQEKMSAATGGFNIPGLF